MVGRFVEQQQPRPAEQQFGERDAHLPSARERFAGLVEVSLGEAKAAQDRRDLQIDAVALEPTESFLQVAVPGRASRRAPPRVRGVVGEPFLERGDLRAHVEQLL